MTLFLKRSITFLCRRADAITNRIECMIFGAFTATFLLSFYGLLNSPAIYAAVFLVLIAFFLLLTSESKIHRPAPTDGKTFQYYVIGIFIAALLLLSCFMYPVSSDGQRIKLARILLGVNAGSAWASASQVDSLSVMYIIPATYSFIFTPIEALHLPKLSYAIFNAVLIIGSLLNLFLLSRHSSIETLFLLVLFIAAPQFVFAGIEEHEEALTFFLSTRTAVWFIAKPLNFRTIFFTMLCAALAVMVKYPTAIFLPFALLVLAWYFDKERIREWLHAKTIVTALVFLTPILLVVFIPEIFIASARGLGFSDLIGNLYKHQTVQSPSSAAPHCGLPQFILRFFEFSFDIVRTWINFLKINISHVIPAYDFMPKGCAWEDTRLASYFTPTALERVSTQFGLVFILAAVGAFIARGHKRALALTAIGLFLLTVAVYSGSFAYWSGTGRYFMVGFLMLLPAFLIAMEALKQRFTPKYYYALIALILSPALFIFIRTADNIPRAITQGDRMAYRAGDVIASLNTIHGKANIYFNDLMPFYTLLRAIPSHDVSLKKEIMPGVTNVIALPNEYSADTNWHDAYWMLPIPSAQGSFVFMGPTTKPIGNTVPTSFYMGIPGVLPKSGEPVEIKNYIPGTDPAAWVKTLGNDYHIRELTASGETRYFITAGDGPHAGLCLKKKPGMLSWHTGSFGSCQGS